MKTVIIGKNQSINECFGELINENNTFTFYYFQPNVAFQEIEKLNNPGVDLVLIDLSSSIKNSCEFIGKMRDLLPDIPVIALHFYTDRALVDEIINAGASAYLLINTSSVELNNAIKEISLGKTYITSEIN
ncbi:MAG: response regulator transcription factor [Candidatus Moranbacteria bacterium]|nr:response regulator transcription factor [Candidatus Moranbacteria bacterium]